MYRLMSFATFIAAATFGASLVNAAVINLGPTEDVVTSVFSPDTNYGGSAVLATNLSNYSQKQYSYMMFDLSSIPAGEQVVGATLNLYQPTGSGSGLSGVSLFRISDDSWDESSVTWNSSPSTTGAVYLDTNPNGYSYVGWSQWDLFSSGLWDASSDQADGLLSLWLAEASSNDQAHQWCSKEASSGEVNYCSGGLEPYLQITTAPVPLPPALWLFGSGLLGLFGVTRRKKAA